MATRVQFNSEINPFVGGDIAVTFDNPVSSGNCIVVIVYSDAVVPIAADFSDSGSNTYFEGRVADDGGGSRIISAFYALNVTGGSSFAVTFNPSGADNFGIIAIEYSGVETSSALDASNEGVAFGSSSPSSGAATATAAGTAIGFVHTDSAATITAAGGWSLVEEYETGDFVGSYSIIDKAVTAGSQTATWTLGGNDNWTAGIIILKDGTGPVLRSTRNIRSHPLGVRLGIGLGIGGGR